MGKYEFDRKDKLPDLKNKRRVILEGSTDANWFDLNKKGLKSQVEEREKGIMEVLRAQPNKLDKS